MFLQRARIKLGVLRIRLVRLLLLLPVLRLLHGLERAQIHVPQHHPRVHPSIKLFVVHVILVILVGVRASLATLDDLGEVVLILPSPSTLYLGADL